MDENVSFLKKKYFKFETISSSFICYLLPWLYKAFRWFEAKGF